MILRITGLWMAFSFLAMLGAQTVEIDLRRNVGEDVLISTSIGARSDLTITAGEETETRKLKLVVSARMVDVLESLEDEEAVYRRLYLFEKVDEDDLVRDVGVDGIELRYQLDEDGDVDCSGPDERFFDFNRLSNEVNRYRGLTGWLPFKATMKVGDKTELDFVPLMPDLLADPDLVGEARATLELISVDEKKGTAEFAGKLTAELVSSEDEALRSVWDFDCKMSISLKRQQIASISLKGKGKLSATQDDVVMNSRVEMTSEWKSEVGSAASEARKKKPTFRNVLREFRERGVSAELPSHYGDLGTRVGFGAEVAGFLSMLNGPESSRRIGARTVATPDDSSMEVVTASAEILKEKYPGATFENITTKAGKGVSMTLMVEENYHVQDYIAGDGQVIIVFYAAGLSEKKTLQEEIKIVRKTIRLL